MESRAPFAECLRSGVAFLGREASVSARKAPVVAAALGDWGFLGGRFDDIHWPYAHDDPFAITRGRPQKLYRGFRSREALGANYEELELRAVQV